MVTGVPGVNPEPWATTADFLFPVAGESANCGMGGAEDTGVVTSVTVSAAVPEMSEEGSDAEIVVAPSATPVARPFEPAVLEIEAVLGDEEDHVTESVRSTVLRSEYVPVAVNCSPAPTATLATGGATVIATSVAGSEGRGVTVSAATPDTSDEGSLAVMVAAPSATPVAKPLLEILAVVVDEEDHVTESVRSRVLRSE